MKQIKQLFPLRINTGTPEQPASALPVQEASGLAPLPPTLDPAPTGRQFVELTPRQVVELPVPGEAGQESNTAPQSGSNSPGEAWPWQGQENAPRAPVEAPRHLGVPPLTPLTPAEGSIPRLQPIARSAPAPIASAVDDFPPLVPIGQEPVVGTTDDAPSPDLEGYPELQILGASNAPQGYASGDQTGLVPETPPSQPEAPVVVQAAIPGVPALEVLHHRGGAPLQEIPHLELIRRQPEVYVLASINTDNDIYRLEGIFDKEAVETVEGPNLRERQNHFLLQYVQTHFTESERERSERGEITLQVTSLPETNGRPQISNEPVKLTLSTLDEDETPYVSRELFLLKVQVGNADWNLVLNDLVS